MVARSTGVVLLALLFLPALPVDAGEDLGVDPRAFAWYAHGAAEEGRAAAIPNLRAYLGKTAGDEDRLVFLARSCAVDALIRLEAVLPGEELAALTRSSFDEAAAILAVRFATPGAALLTFEAMDADDGFGDEPWIAIGNRLCREKTPGFAVRLLARFTSELRIYVDDSVREVAWRPPHGSIPGDAIFPIPKTFPPIPVHRVTTLDGPRTTLLSPGRRPIRSYRYECEGTYGNGDSYGEPHRDDVRPEWMEDLIGTSPGRLQLPRFPCRSVTFPSERLLLLQIEAAREEVAEGFHRVADRLIAAKVLTEREREWVRPRIAMTLVDRRSRKRKPIPTLPEEWIRPPQPDLATLTAKPAEPAPTGPRIR